MDYQGKGEAMKGKTFFGFAFGARPDVGPAEQPGCKAKPDDPHLITSHLCAPCELHWSVDETPPACKPYECDCGRRFYSRDRVTDCTNTGHKDRPL